MSVVTPAEVLVLVAPGISEPDLQELINREESRLEARLGTPLTGGISDVTYRPTRTGDPILLPRLPVPDSVSVEESGEAVDVIVAGARVSRASGSWSTPTFSYDFADEDEVRAVIIDLIRLALSESPYSQEGTEGHSYTRSTNVDRQRAQLIATLNPHRGKPASVSQ
jgi:hypothetical protein